MFIKKHPLCNLHELQNYRSSPLGRSNPARPGEQKASQATFIKRLLLLQADADRGQGLIRRVEAGSQPLSPLSQAHSCSEQPNYTLEQTVTTVAGDIWLLGNFPPKKFIKLTITNYSPNITEKTASLKSDTVPVFQKLTVTQQTGKNHVLKTDSQAKWPSSNP